MSTSRNLSAVKEVIDGQTRHIKEVQQQVHTLVTDLFEPGELAELLSENDANALKDQFAVSVGQELQCQRLKQAIDAATANMRNNINDDEDEEDENGDCCGNDANTVKTTVEHFDKAFANLADPGMSDNQELILNSETYKKFDSTLYNIKTAVSTPESNLPNEEAPPPAISTATAIDLQDVGNTGLDDSQPMEMIDDDLAMTVQSAIPMQTLDPITQRRLQDPVKNKHCGHAYGRATLDKMIYGKFCPFTGCANKRKVTRHQIVECPKLVEMLEGMPPES